MVILLFVFVLFESFTRLNIFSKNPFNPTGKRVLYACLLGLVIASSFVHFMTWVNMRYGLVYGYLSVGFLMTFWKTPHRLKVLSIRTWLRLSMRMLILFLVFSPLFIFPAYTLQATGAYTVLTHAQTYYHTTLLDPFDSTQHRFINVRYWYPDHNQALPLLVFSHGGISVNTSNESLFIELASHGYAVASIDHPSHSFYTTATDGTKTRINWDYLRDLMRENASKDPADSFRLYNTWMNVRTDDLHFFLETVKRPAFMLTPTVTLDTTKIGLMGHSLGGSAALCMGRMVTDLVLVIALESPFMCDIEGVDDQQFVFTDDPYPVPLLNVYTDSTWSRLDQLAQYGQNHHYVHNPSEDVNNLYIEGAGHFNLSDLALSSPFFTRLLNGFKTTDNRALLNALNAELLDFINNAFYPED